MTPLRIAVFTDSALPILNGVSVSIDALVQELRNRGHGVHLFTAAHFRHRDPDPNTHRFFAIETPWTKDYPLAIPPFYPMLRQFRRHEFDIVHTHTPFTIGFVGLRWAQSHDIPIVSTYHTLYDKYAHYIPFFPKRYVRYKIAKHTNFYYNGVDHVITPSNAALKWLRRHSVNTPITVVPTANAQIRPIDRSEVRQRLGVAPEHKVLLYVGRIAREKNLATLFEACAQAMRADPDIRLWLVGDGPYRQACVEHSRALGIGDRVRFVGFVPREEVDPFYAMADLFVFASMTETQGLVVSEAMVYGLPAVVVQGGGAGASVRDDETGFLVRNDPEAMSEAILRLVGDEQRYASFSSAARIAVRSYTRAEMADLVLDVYRQAMGGAVTPRSQPSLRS
ncbi:MAG TPA: glycosyltransferase [Fimbriimonadaceae bacterium]|nr:glycosyltransferase [Fimbriimonadaceae bacterium]HRJ96604.1 glycosyltransferase [Fimbriimonadaceae bacterium]